MILLMFLMLLSIVVALIILQMRRVLLQKQAEQNQLKKLEQAMDNWIAAYNRRQKEKNENR